MNRSAVFLDKDGTLVEDVPYNVSPDLIRLTHNARAGLKLMHQHNHLLIVITNQSGVARGYFAESALQPVKKRLEDLLMIDDILLSGFYYCPHHPDGVLADYAIACDCRKPKPGMIKQAAQDHSLDLNSSWFIGDILHDIEAGRSAGCRTILLDNGNETEWKLSAQRMPHYRVANLLEAAQIVTANPFARSHDPTADEHSPFSLD
jgi:D-glycero-D-manno-heptose 1,7-bisphosphate phosphatase